jgi:hypothetical protein
VTLSLNSSVEDSVEAFTPFLPQAYNQGSFLPLLVLRLRNHMRKAPSLFWHHATTRVTKDTTFAALAVHTAHHCNIKYQSHVMRLQPMVHAQDTSATQLDLD